MVRLEVQPSEMLADGQLIGAQQEKAKPATNTTYENAKKLVEANPAGGLHCFVTVQAPNGTSIRYEISCSDLPRPKGRRGEGEPRKREGAIKGHRMKPQPSPN